MTNKAKVIWITIGTVIVAGGIWLWWRQKDAVPLAANPVMQQARATLTTANSDNAAAATPPTEPSINDQVQTLLGSVIPGYVPLT